MMKIDTLTGASIAFAAFAAWYVLKKPAAAPGTASGTAFGMSADQRAQVGAATAQNNAWIDEIFNISGTPFDNGWRYYENGTAIDPEGNYYQNGVKVWSPA